MRTKAILMGAFALVACDPGEDGAVDGQEEARLPIRRETAAATADAEGASRAAPPVPEEGMWFNSARDGNGMGIYPRPGNNQMAFVWLTYTTGEQPIWYGAELTRGAGSWEGDLLESTWNGSTASSHVVGTAKLRQSDGHWTYEWTLGGISGNEPITEVPFGNHHMRPDCTGLWHSVQQPGWFVEMDCRGTTCVANLLVFAANGEPTWVHGVADSESDPLNFPMLYVRGTNLCPGCTGTPSKTFQLAGTMTLKSSAGCPGQLLASIDVTFPGGSWSRPEVTLVR